MYILTTEEEAQRAERLKESEATGRQELPAWAQEILKERYLTPKEWQDVWRERCITHLCRGCKAKVDKEGLCWLCETDEAERLNAEFGLPL